MGIIPQLSSCCCGCRLRDGTLVVLILPLVCVLLSPFVNSAIEIKGQSLLMKIIASLIIIGVCAAGLYGVFQQKRAFLVPFLVVDVFTMIGGMIYIVQNLIFNIVSSLLMLLFIPLYGYAFLVVLSYYREMGVKKSTTTTSTA